MKKLLAVLAALTIAACAPSECEPQDLPAGCWTERAYVTCVEGRVVITWCSEQGLWCRDVANQPPTCGLPAPRCLGCQIEIQP